MKYVAKGGEPHEMQNWKRENRQAGQNPAFDNLPKSLVRLALLAEQGWLCGYTMMRLQSESECHIEHMLPQSKHPFKQVEFGNFLACHPKDGGAQIGFGAPNKGGKEVSSENFVFPTDQFCEEKFDFLQDGQVVGQSVAAKSTVNILNLNHDELVQRRRQIFVSLGLTSRPSAEGRQRRGSISSAQARRIAQQMKLKDGSGKYAPFCVAVACVANRYAANMEKMARQQRFQHPPE